MRSFRAGSRVLRHITQGPATQHEADLVACVDREACIAEHASCRDIDGKSSRLDHGGAKCYVRMPSAFRPTSHSPKEAALKRRRSWSWLLSSFSSAPGAAAAPGPCQPAR